MNDLDQLKRKMPQSLHGSACDDAGDVCELLDLARTQVDLSKEGQDGAMSQRKAQIVKRWIKKHRPVGVDWEGNYTKE